MMLMLGFVLLFVFVFPLLETKFSLFGAKRMNLVISLFLS